MTAYADMAVAPRGLPSMREAGLWAGAALVVLFAHATIAYGIHAFQPAEPPEAAEPALMIDLAPLAISTPEAIEAETVTEEMPEEVVQPVETAEIAKNALNTETLRAETPEIAEPETAEIVKPEVLSETEPKAAEALKPETMKPEAVEPETAEAVTPDTEPEAVEPEVAEATPVEPELTAPEVPEVVTPEVVAALPEPRPVVEEEQEKVQPPRKAETRKPAKTEKAEKKAPEKKKVAKAEAAPAPKSQPSVESRASKAPTVSPARWQSKVLAWLNRHKRYPAGAKSRREQGTVRLAFAINASGSVISVRVTGSSGNAELDQAALDMVRRASPVPAPPPEIARSKMNLAVPVQFSLR